ncbi:hypothetical protein K9M48_02820 [Candidatus Gracilibacteria bacterium]|nr:hypothetical protein [Candidatus Gracilibacteria bacterium]
MSKVFKKTFTIVFIMFVGQAIFCGFTFAQGSGNAQVECGDNPTICSSPGLQFQYYEQFVKEMLAGIQTVQGDGKDLGDYNYLGGLFTNKIFNIPTENKNIFEKLVSEIEESINKKISTASATVFILSSLGIGSYKDIIGMSILTKSRPFIRDWKTLLDLETQINEMFYELGLSAMADDVIVDTSKFQLILDKYKDSNKLFYRAKIYDGAKYKDLVSMLLKMNGSMKTFLSMGTINQFDKYSQGGIDGFDIAFDMESIQILDSSYECARGFFKCDSSRKDFVKNIKNIGTSFKKGGASAKENIVTANKNFADALRGVSNNYKKDKSEGEKVLTDRQIDLLRDVYGINTSKLTKQQGLLLTNSWKNLATSTIGNIKLSSNFNDDYFNKKEKDQKEKDKDQEEKDAVNPNLGNETLLDNISELSDLLESKIDYPVIAKDDFKQSLEIVMKSVNKKHQDELSVLVSIDPTPYLQFYTQIGYRIRDVIDIIGSKDKNLIKNIGTVCELQCSNKGNAGCYAR